MWRNRRFGFLKILVLVILCVMAFVYQMRHNQYTFSGTPQILTYCVSTDFPLCLTLWQWQKGRKCERHFLDCFGSSAVWPTSQAASDSCCFISLLQLSCNHNELPMVIVFESFSPQWRCPGSAALASPSCQGCHPPEEKKMDCKRGNKSSWIENKWM